MRGYVFLAISIVSEVFGTTMLKLSEGFSHILPSIGVAIGFGVAFFCLSLSLKTLPLSLAYAIWAGVGTAFTAVIGVMIWEEPFNLATAMGILLIIGGVALLNASGKKETETS